MPNRKTRAIAILISLVMAVVVTMFVAAMLSTLPQQIEQGQNTREGRQAEAAARSGLEYAWNRLQENPGWRGDLTGNAAGYTLSSAPLTVYEDHGNVWGFIQTPDGEKSQFRIRFNYQNSGSPSQTLSAVAASYLIDSPYVSINNLNSASPTPFYRGDLPGYAVTGASLAPNQVPMFSCALIVEGLAGNGLRDTTSSNPKPPGGSRRVVSRVLEANLARPSMSSLDAAVYGGQITSFIGAGHTLDVESKVAGVPPAMRSLGNIGLGSSTYQTSSLPKGRVYLPTSASFSAGSGGTAPDQIKQTRPALQSSFLKLRSNDVVKANPLSDATLPAGTYVWRVTGVVDYYPQEYDGSTVPTGPPTRTFASSSDFTTFIGSSGGIGPGPADPILMDPSTYTLKLQKTTYVAPAGTVKGLAIVPEGLVTASANRPKNIFQGVSSGAPVLSSTGNITLEGALIGKGSLTSDKNIKFQGPSVFEADSTRSVSIYAKGNIDLQRTPDSVVTNLGQTGVLHPALRNQDHNGAGDGNDIDQSAQAASVQSALGLTPFGGPKFAGSDVLVGGLIYAGGNFTVDLTPSTAGLPQGSFYLRGAAVSYGNNTDAGELPGAPGTGVNFANAANAQVFYDPAFVMQSMSMSAPSKLSLNFLNSL